MNYNPLLLIIFFLWRSKQWRGLIYYLPCSKAPFSFDVSKVIFDRHTIKTGSKIQVKAGHIELSRHEFFCSDISQTVHNFSMLIG